MLTSTDSRRGAGDAAAAPGVVLGEGHEGSALMGSLQISRFLTGTLWALPLTCFYLPQSAMAYLFHQSVKTHYLCSGPLVLTPFVRNQGPCMGCMILVVEVVCPLSLLGMVHGYSVANSL